MENHAEANSSPDVKKLAELIKGIKVAMMTTIDTDGCLYSRPMMAQEIEFDGDLWFFTGKSTGKIQSLVTNPNVNLSYASPDDSKFVSVAGQAVLVDDMEKKRKLWKPIYKAWFPKGVDDPDLVLLKVDVERAEYWDSPSNTMVKLVGFARALLKGQPYTGSPNEHKKVDLHH